MSDETATRVYSYGCPYWADPGEDVTTQLWLANRLWNKLVEIYRAHEDARAAIWLTVPDVAAATERVNEAQAALDGVRQDMLAARKRDRTTVPREEDGARLAAAREPVSAAKADLDAARKKARLALRPAFATALRERALAVKATYAEFVQEQGLGWGTFNDVVRRRFPAAVAKVEERRKTGLPADLRFRRFDGTGTLTVQIQHQAGAPPRTIPALNSGTHPKAGTLSLSPWRDPAQGRARGPGRHGTLRLAIGRSRSHGPLAVELPVVLDRYMPAAADVAEVKITRRATGSHLRWQAAIVCREAAATAPATGASTAVRLSWASAGDGWLRVAYAGSTSPLPPLPPALTAAVQVAADGLSAEIFHHPSWRKLIERDEDIRSIRDRNLDVLRAQVVAALKASADLAATVETSAADVARWRSPARFVRLARRWPSDDPLAAVLEAWRARDRHLWDYECFSDDTEILTRNGWRSVTKVTRDDLLATVDLETDAIEYQRPTRLISRHYEGAMVQIGGGLRQRLDLLVTPQHRMVLQNSSGNRVKLAQDLRRHDNVKIRAAAWAGSAQRTITLPASRYYREASVDAGLLARFIGWYVAEGYCSRYPDMKTTSTHHRVVIYQSRGASREAIRNVLDMLPWRYTESERGFTISNEQVYGLVSGMGGDAYTKRVPQWIKDSGRDVIRAFTESAVLGDGNIWNGHESYATVSQGLADDMQELYLKLGYGTSITLKRQQPCALPGRPVYHGAPYIYIVHRHTRRWASLRNAQAQPNFRSVPYQGMVHCATVPNGTLIVRRNGKVMVCGNCNERAQVLAARKDTYRKVAAWLCGGAREITVDGTDLAARKQVPGVGREDREPARRGRAQMQEVAPGELREAILGAAARRGIPVTMVKKAAKKETAA